MEQMTESEARRVSFELMGSSDMAYVTTIDEDGLPQTRVMFNLRNLKAFPGLMKLYVGHDEDFLVYLGTNTSSEKMSQIHENPSVCVFYCDNEEYRSLMISGRAEIVEDTELKNQIWQHGWEIYYPQGPSDPDYTVLRLLPVKAKGWHRNRPFDFRPGGTR
jgi:general stress protein 26